MELKFKAKRDFRNEFVFKSHLYGIEIRKKYYY